MPIVRISQAVKTMACGDRLQVKASDPAFKADLEAWVSCLGHRLVAPSTQAAVRATEVRLQELESRLAELSQAQAQGRQGITIIAFSGEMDKLMTAFMVATGKCSIWS